MNLGLFKFISTIVTYYYSEMISQNMTNNDKILFTLYKNDYEEANSAFRIWNSQNSRESELLYIKITKTQQTVRVASRIP